MAIAKGAKSSLAWATETAYGVAPSDNWHNLPMNSETLDENINNIQSEDIRSDRRNPGMRGGNIATGGQVTHDFGTERTLGLVEHLLACTGVRSDITPSALAAQAYKRGDYVLNADGDLFICLQGGTVTTTTALNGVTSGDKTISDASVTKWRYVATAGSVPTVYKWLFKAGTDFQTGGVAMQKAIMGGNSNLYVQFLGGRVNSLELNVPQEGIVKATWNLLFATSDNKGTSNGAGTPTTTAEDPLAGYDALIHFNDANWDGDSTITGRTIHREFSMNVANNFAEDSYVVGSRFRNDLPEGKRMATGRLSVYFVDSAEYDIFKNETEVPLALSFIHNGSFMIWKFPEVKITGSGTPKISGQGPLQADFDWTAFFQDNTEETSGYDIVVEVHNTLTAIPSAPTA